MCHSDIQSVSYKVTILVVPYSDLCWYVVFINVSSVFTRYNITWWWSSKTTGHCDVGTFKLETG